MKFENGKIDGDIQIAEPIEMHGMFTGNVTVVPGGFLKLHGMACKSVTCKGGGKLVVHGTISGDLIDAGGDIEVRGMVRGQRFRAIDL